MSEHKGFTVIEGGKSNNPGQVTALPEGFKAASHATHVAGAIACTDADGAPGELIPLEMMPPELMMLLMLSMLQKSRPRH